MPRGPESFMQLQEVHTRSILSSLGVPADIRSTSQRFAANVEFIMQELGDNVKDFHRRVKPLLEKAFAFVWRQLIRNKVVQKSKKQLEKGFPRPMKSPVEVVLTFNYNPVTTYDNIKQLYEDGHISHEDFGKLGLELRAMPPDMRIKNGEAVVLERHRKLLEIDTAMKLKIQQAKITETTKRQADKAKSSTSSTSKTSKTSEPAKKKAKPTK